MARSSWLTAHGSQLFESSHRPKTKTVGFLCKSICSLRQRATDCDFRNCLSVAILQAIQRRVSGLHTRRMDWNKIYAQIVVFYAERIPE